jgi:hypothetical protein
MGAPRFPVATTSWDGVAQASNPVFNPGYGGVFIPEIWSSKILEKFYDATVLAAISNTNYEGEISNYGDKVIIRTKSLVSTAPYQVDMKLNIQRPISNVVELLIDKGEYFNVVLDDVMEIQSDLNQLSMWSDDASEQMKIVIDKAVLTSIAAGVKTSYGPEVGGVTGNSGNQGLRAGRKSGDINLGVTGTGPLIVAPRAPAAGQTEIMDLIVNLGLVLDEANIPETGRWMVIPAWMAGMIKRSELRDASLTGDATSILRNGRLGGIDRFTLYMSNLLPAPAAGETRIYAGHPHGLTFASQLSKVETLRAESTFGTLLRGLQVWGSKVVDGSAIATAVVKKAPAV